MNIGGIEHWFNWMVFLRWSCLSVNFIVAMSLPVNLRGYFRSSNLFSNILIEASKVSGLVLLRRCLLHSPRTIEQYTFFGCADVNSRY